MSMTRHLPNCANGTVKVEGKIYFPLMSRRSVTRFAEQGSWGGLHSAPIGLVLQGGLPHTASPSGILATLHSQG
ncbi:hypothetical protein E2C01_099742 [Portunus trituberculatus]|uniref:Uncharacterized protein n=1 Tax=Portunus trituberculatus TaxID=210409 RepID=A0A5B7K6A6_PORTR|nr:hypothetical protein [Portunus trituberculatus]